MFDFKISEGTDDQEITGGLSTTWSLSAAVDPLG